MNFGPRLAGKSLSTVLVACYLVGVLGLAQLARAQDPPTQPPTGDTPPTSEAPPGDTPPKADVGDKGGGKDAAPPAPSVVPPPAASVPPVVPQPITNKEIYQKTLKSTAFIVVPYEDSASLGTGWVLDLEKRLIVTNHHVVGTSDRCEVYFPAYKDGKLIADQKHYLRDERSIAGKVFDSDRTRDLAIIQLESIPEGIEALKLCEQGTSPGEMVFSVGNPGSSDALWVYTTGTVRAVYHRAYRLSGDQLVDAQVVETQSPTNRGDSGGPVVNDRGELVAVVSAGDPDAQLMTLFIDVSEVMAYRDEMIDLLDPTTAEQYARRGERYRKTRRLDRAISDLTEAVKLDPKLAEAYSNRGWAFTDKRDFDSALGDFDEAIALNPQLADAFHGRGYLHNEMGKYDEAIADCTKSIRFDPTNATAYNNRAYGYQKKGDFDKAVADYSRAIELRPNDPDYYNNRGDCYYYAQYYQDAVSDYSRAIEANPRFALGYYNRGYVYQNHLGNPDQAILDLTQAIELVPTYAAAYENRGEAHWSKKEYELALADYTAAIQANPNYAEAYHDRGYLYHYNLKNPEQAMADYNKAISLNPNVASYYNFRGNLFFEGSQWDDAIADYSNAIKLNPKSATYYSNRGNAYAKKGDMARAKADYDAASAIDPTFSAEPPKQQERRYLYIKNSSAKAITVYVVYYTKTVNGDWRWYPAGPGRGQSVQFSFAPGEESYVQHNGFKILAKTMRIWAESTDGASGWYRDRDVDVILCDDQGYLSAKPETYTYSFTD